MNRPLHRLAALAVLLGLAAGCSGGGSGDAPAPDAAGEPRRGGTAIVGTGFDLDAWNEYLARRDTTVRWLRRMYLPLARETSPGKPGDAAYEPALAGSWSFSADRTELTFVLREATWSDGEPIEADDVVYTWRAQTDPASPWVGAGSKSRIVAVEADPADPRRVTFRFDGPYPYQFADAVEGAILPRHRFEPIPVADWTTHDWSQERVGSGPFLLDAYTPGNEIVFVRNPAYWRDGFPRLDRVVVRIVSEPSILLTQLRTGEIDLVDKLSPRDAERLSRDDSIRVVDYPASDVDFVGWNCARPPFDDPRVRRALTLAIDREALVDELLFGHGRVATSLVPSSWAAAATLDPLPHDPRAARALLREAGYRTADGEPGEPLAFTLLTNAGNALRQDVATKIQAQLAAVGVEVALSTPESRALTGDLVAGTFDGFLRGLTISGRPPLDIVFTQAAIPTEENPRAGMNVMRYRSAALDAAVADAAAARDWDALKTALDRAQRQIAEDLPMTPLYETRGLAAHGPNLAGVRIDAGWDALARLEEFWRR